MLSGFLAFTNTVCSRKSPALEPPVRDRHPRFTTEPRLSPFLGAVRQVPQRSDSLAHLWPLVFPLCRTSKEAPFRIAL